MRLIRWFIGLFTAFKIPDMYVSNKWISAHMYETGKDKQQH